METLTADEKQARIAKLHAEKVKLLDKYGLFGGGTAVNNLFKIINAELETLGVDPNS